MGKVSKPWVRGAVSLAVLAGLAAALIASPVGAAFNPTKAKIKKIAKKQANKAVQADNSTAEGIFASFNDGPVDIPNTLTAIASLTVPAGKYAIFAKLIAEDIDPGFDVTSSCQLTAGADLDEGEAFADNPSDVAASSGGTIAMEVTHEFGEPGGTIQVLCADNNEVDQARFIKIIAIRGPTLSNAPSARLVTERAVGRAQ